MKRVVVGLSGGVDSSVAAYILIEQGYEVIGIFMRNWNDESVVINNECPWIDDSNDANLIAQQLGIPFQVIDFSSEYKKRIVDYMFTEYQKGRTPNPDILCNREIKFDIFLQTALQLNADFVATGHYCQKAEEVINGTTIYKLIAGADKTKDQSYFLCQVNQQQLSKALFPIGHLQKHEVRQIAKKMGLVTADKKDSQGLCFIGKVRLPEFLQQQLKPKEGNVVKISEDYIINQNKTVEKLTIENLEQLSKPYLFNENSGKIIGKHQGAHFYTIGQRKGLNIGGFVEPLFVLATNTQTNTIYVGEGKNHPGLYRPALKVEKNEIHWVRPDLEPIHGTKKRFLARIRYRQQLEWATFYFEETALFVIFDQPQRGIASGQFVAWYNNNELIGSGVIN